MLISEGTITPMAFIKSQSFYDSLVGAGNLLLSAKGTHGLAVSAAAAAAAKASEMHSKGSPFSRFGK